MMIQTNFYKIKPYSNLLLIESFSSWDDRVAMDFVKDTKSIILEHYKGRAWAILHDTREWNLGTPETERILSGIANAEFTSTITHHALVTGQSGIKKWQIEKIFKDVTLYKTQIFEDIHEAETWLASYGYNKTDL
jgi:hypothetical protein